LAAVANPTRAPSVSVLLLASSAGIGSRGTFIPLFVAFRRGTSAGNGVRHPRQQYVPAPANATDNHPTSAPVPAHTGPRPRASEQKSRTFAQKYLHLAIDKPT